MSSSDLERARLLSCKLAAPPGRASLASRLAGRPAYGQPPYLNLRGEAAEPPRRPAPAAYQPPDEPVPRSFDGWENLLQWCLRQLGAESGFAVDTQGFVIATRGRPAQDGFEAMGAELCFAMEQLERVDPTAGGLLWVELEFGRRRIVCLRATPQESDHMLVGFVGVSADSMKLRTTIEQVVVEAMPTLS